MTAFIARSSEDAEPVDLLRWPDAPPDPAKVADIFGRVGLPERLV